MSLDLMRELGSADRYPLHALEGCESALVLFAAAFHGIQDAVWIADAGLTATCVDVDARRLGEMVLAYPEGWEYVPGDAYVYATLTERVWDVVSLDPSSGQFQACADRLELWCSRARHVVILGCGDDTEIVVPDGWTLTEKLWRSRFSGGVFWAVLERC